MGAFASVPFDGWSSIAAVEQWMLSSEKLIEFIDGLMMAVLQIAF